MITCATHGQIAGYIVCSHVLNGAPVAHLLEATTGESRLDDLGEALCADCMTMFDGHDPEVDLEPLKLICANCLQKAIGPFRAH